MTSFIEQRRSGGSLHIQLDPFAAKALDKLAVLGPKVLQNAQRRSINKVMMWLKTQVARTISVQERIAQSAVRQRMKLYKITGNASKGKLWIGLNPIEASRIGRVSSGKSNWGVSVAGRRYSGAFYSSVYGKGKDIWIRKASKQYDPSLYFPQKSRGGVIDPKLKHRFPLVKAKVEIEAARKHFENWVKVAEERLLIILKQEVNYELQKSH